MKKLITGILILALVLSFSGTALAATGGFSDIKDAETQGYVDVLSMLGVVEGMGDGTFNPTGTLTRAQFCKMAVVIMGLREQEPLYRNRTIFPDVRSTHWARGFINLAVSGEKRIILGNPDGTFKPESKITFAEAVTILMRILGYTDADAGMIWPQGYINLAADTGLSKGISLSASSALTRAQAAKLFCSLLNMETKSGSPYINLLGTASPDVVITNLNAKAEDGTMGAIGTSTGVYKSAAKAVPETILGKRGTLLLDGGGRVIAFVPKTSGDKTITVSSAQASWLKDLEGTTYSIPVDSIVYTADGSMKYGEAWIDIFTGVKVTIFYTAGGKVEGLFINTASYEASAVAPANFSGNPFAHLTGSDGNYTIYKNGAPATVSDIRAYDVATYDRSSKALNISDGKLTGTYQNASPNMESPAKITVLGNSFTVLPGAIDDLAKFKLGDMLTLLLTTDNKVAGAVALSAAKSSQVGIIQASSGETATVELLSGITIREKTNWSANALSLSVGELVEVSASAKNAITLTKLTSAPTTAVLDLKAGKLGSAAFSPALTVYERVGTSPLEVISLDSIVPETLPGIKVLYYKTDYAGRVSILILNDVTGDRYTYGMLVKGVIAGSDPDFGSWTNQSVSVVNSTDGIPPIIGNVDFETGDYGGVAVAKNGSNSAGVITLTSIEGVRRSTFVTSGGVTTITINGVKYTVSDKVECYNAVAGVWFNSLAEARAFSDDLTIYYDRSPAEGGKIRVVVAN